MVAAFLFVLVLLAAAGGFAVIPDNWSDEEQAVAIIELAVAGALAVVGLAAFHVLPSAAQRRVTIALRIVLLLVALGALAIARGLPFDLSYGSRWAFGALAALAIVIVAVSIAHGRLPAEVKKGATSKRGLVAVALVALPALALVTAVLVSDVPGWARWALALGGVLATAAIRASRQATWPDVAALALVAVGAVAAFGEFTEREQKEKAPTVTFTVEDGVTVLEKVEKDGKAVLLVIEPAKAAEDTPISYESARHVVTVDEELPEGDRDEPVRVTIERGVKDANAMALGADLEGAVAVYVLSGGK